MSELLNALKFVQGSVAKKDYLPALTHFCIENGTVRGYNGTLALCSPIPFDLACKPKALPLVSAIKNCVETVALALTGAGRLSIKSGSFKAFVECVEGETPHVEPEGERKQIDGKALLAAMKVLSPFVGDDASRPWSNGMLLKQQSVFATNNIVLTQYWTGVDFPVEANIPRAAIKEVLRIDEAPEFIQVHAGSMTFHYSSGRWIRTALLETNWPDLSKVLDRPSNQQPVDPAIFAGLEVVKPFADKLGRITFHEGHIVTSLTDGDGARYEIPGLTYAGSYNVDHLASLQGVAQTIDFSAYPGPVIFHGERLRGAIIGLRQL